VVATVTSVAASAVPAAITAAAAAGGVGAEGSRGFCHRVCGVVRRRFASKRARSLWSAAAAQAPDQKDDDEDNDQDGQEAVRHHGPSVYHADWFETGASRSSD
jgi:hypothetical protein